MSDTKITPVVLCGGSGTRLWPRSRSFRPKQFLPLIGEGTLFEQAMRRCHDERFFNPPIIVTGEDHLPLLEPQLGESAASQIIVEPESKNTAAAIALAASLLPPQAVMLVCPSDHHIADEDAFLESALVAADLSREGWLVSLTTEARAPETGFGYVRRGEPIGEVGFKVAKFVEKPDSATAKSYVDAGDYAWNSGIFVFRASDFLDELELHRPALLDAVRKSVSKGRKEHRCFHPQRSAFQKIESESVDYAVLENSDRVAMVAADMAWSDIGSWPALRLALPKDERGNVARGPATLVECRNVLVDSDGARVLAIGLDDIIIVVDGNDIVVTAASTARKVGPVSEQLDRGLPGDWS